MWRTHYWPGKKSLRRGKGNKISDRKGDGRWLEPETDGRIDTPNPPLEGSLTSPH